MNRLIIIGNGFDIAHGLKTKYNDYISHYWKQVNETSFTDKFISFGVSGYELNSCKCLKDVVDYLGAGLNTTLRKKAHSTDYIPVSYTHLTLPTIYSV